MGDVGPLQDLISASLTEQFNFKLFYHAQIFDILPFDKEIFYRLLDEIDVGKKQYSFRSIISNEAYNYIYKFDELLNLAFKYDLCTTTPHFDRFRTYTPYYEWILDIDNFDYSRFEVEWVNHYKTKPYYKVMSKSIRFKQYIRSI